MTNVYETDIISNVVTTAAHKTLKSMTTANLENDTEKRKESHSESVERLTGKKELVRF